MRIKVSDAGSERVLTRSGDRWVREGDAGQVPDPGLVARFLQELRDLKGEAVLAGPPERFGPQRPLQRIRLVDTAGKEIALIRVGKRLDGSHPVDAG